MFLSTSSPLAVGPQRMASHREAARARWSSVIRSSLFVSALALTFSIALGATPAEAQGQDVRVPQTAQDHLELAALYERVAVHSRGEADSVRKSLQTELRRLASFPNKTGSEFPWVTKLKRAAQPKIDAAEKAAEVAARSADYHRLRAKEVEGLEFATLTASLGRNSR